MRPPRDEEFRRFVIDRRADLLRTATLLTAGDRHLAEDVVQSTLTRLYLAWPLFTRAANRDGYARRALVNALMDEHRRPWRRQERSSPEVPDLPTVEPQAGTERTDALNAALADLPPRMRAALVYRYFHDLSVADTADALSCSQGTVKSQTARALERLRTLMDATPPQAPPPASPTSSHPSLSAVAPTPHLTRSI